MTYTRTETYEERAWRLALESTDPAVKVSERAAALRELVVLLGRTPRQSRDRTRAALKRLSDELTKASL